jgi:hypothetical protein
MINWLKINLNSLLRSITTPIINYIIAINDSRNKIIIDYWTDIKHYSPEKFSEFINRCEIYPYTPEKVDNTIISPNQFFMDRSNTGRDCDDWAFMWDCWGKENGYKPYKLMVWEVGNEKDTCHMTCVLCKQNLYYLCDYEWTGTSYLFLDDAIKEIAKKYKYKNPLQWGFAQ